MTDLTVFSHCPLGPEKGCELTDQTVGSRRIGIRKGCAGDGVGSASWCPPWRAWVCLGAFQAYRKMLDDKTLPEGWSEVCDTLRRRTRAARVPWPR